MNEEMKKRKDIVYNQELPYIKTEKSTYDSSGNYVKKQVIEIKAHMIEKAKKIYDQIVGDIND